MPRWSGKAGCYTKVPLIGTKATRSSFGPRKHPRKEQQRAKNGSTSLLSISNVMSQYSYRATRPAFPTATLVSISPGPPERTSTLAQLVCPVVQCYTLPLNQKFYGILGQAYAMADLNLLDASYATPRDPSRCIHGFYVDAETAWQSIGNPFDSEIVIIARLELQISPWPCTRPCLTSKGHIKSPRREGQDHAPDCGQTQP